MMVTFHNVTLFQGHGSSLAWRLMASSWLIFQSTLIWLIVFNDTHHLQASSSQGLFSGLGLVLSVLGVIRTITPCWSLWSWLDVSMVFCCVYQSTRTRYLEVLNFLAATLPILFFDATKMCVEAWLKMRPQVLLTGSVHNYGCVKIHKALICSTFIYTCSNTYLWKNF